MKLRIDLFVDNLSDGYIANYLNLFADAIRNGQKPPMTIEDEKNNIIGECEIIE